MQLMHSKLEYPALLCSPVFSQIYVKNIDELVRVGEIRNRWPEHGYWQPGELLDISGRAYKILGVKNIPPRPFWIRILEFAIGSRWYLRNFRAELELSESTQLTLEEYKNRVVRIIKKETVQGVSRKKRVSMVLDSQSFAEIIYVLWGEEVFDGVELTFVPRQGSELSIFEKGIAKQKENFKGRTYLELQARVAIIHPLALAMVVLLLLVTIHVVADQFNDIDFGISTYFNME